MAPVFGPPWDKVCGDSKGVLLPLFPDDEPKWNQDLRLVLYGIALGWSFLGVAIIADVFMSAIEKITSKKRRIRNPITGQQITIFVWNDTVANLTLMALGSSAPEILLSVIELVLKNKMFSGELGPSTIVGSAAFNLLCISAVCVVAIPDGDIRKIKNMPVFGVTAISSILAYVWLAFILLVSSKNKVDLWEAILTALFFPLLVAVAFFADKSFPPFEKPIVPLEDRSPDEIAAVITRIRQRQGDHLSEEAVLALARKLTAPKKTRATYRAEARKSVVTRSSQVKPVCGDELTDFVVTKDPVIFEFADAYYAVLESSEKVAVTVIRQGPVDIAARVCFSTRDGTAVSSGPLPDFVAREGVLEFEPGETQKDICITIVDDNKDDETTVTEVSDSKMTPEVEDDETFEVFLSTPSDEKNVELGSQCSAEVTIIDCSRPGILAFEKPTLAVCEMFEDVVQTVRVLRKHGCLGRVSCAYRTEGDSAVAGVDFDDISGTLVFEPGQAIAEISVTIKAKHRYEKSELFRLVISDPQGGATFDRGTDGGASSNICTIELNVDPEGKNFITGVIGTISMNRDHMREGKRKWKNQLRAAFKVSGEDDDDDGDESSHSIFDYVLHICSFPWKLLFALVPPTDFGGGWVTFFVSLAAIGILTAAVGDLASVFGCLLGISEMMTALTFVALGTSLPDTFASKTAAVGDPHADASIGNITGSNSVNVFLGLGMPYVMGAFYWEFKKPTEEWLQRYTIATSDGKPYLPDGGFINPAGNLGFSVIVFCLCAVACFVVLMLRRHFVGGELGGPTVPKYCTAALFVSMWCFYIIISWWNEKFGG